MIKKKLAIAWLGLIISIGFGGMIYSVGLEVALPILGVVIFAVVTFLSIEVLAGYL